MNTPVFGIIPEYVPKGPREEPERGAPPDCCRREADGPAKPCDFKWFSPALASEGRTSEAGVVRSRAWKRRASNMAATRVTGDRSSRYARNEDLISPD
jgi:hypothetical protein